MTRHLFEFSPTRILLCSLAICWPAAALAQTGATGNEWPAYGADKGMTKYSPLDQIDADNVNDLEIVWRRPRLEPSYLEINPNQRTSANHVATPIMRNGVGYVPNGVGLVEAFDPGTGETIWAQEVPGDGDGLPGAVTRGLAWWSDGDDARILAQRNVWLYALDAETGAPIAGFGENGRVNLQRMPADFERYRWGGVPVVVRDTVIVGQGMSDTFAGREAPPSEVQAFDVRTGALRWTWSAIPQEGDVGVETWQDRSWSYTGHAPVWSLMSADEDLGMVYLPLSSSTNDMYGGHRIGDNLFTQSIVALDAESGEMVWYYQMVRHGLWDYDIPAAPVLMDIVVEGQEIPAIAQITKQAFTFVFDRRTGEPVWDIEDRPVPQSDVPGEVTAPTQPFPTLPPAFDRQGATVENLIDFTPELRAEALEIFSNYVTGPMFTPPSVAEPDGTRGTIQLPGSQGGADVQGAAFDPETGYFYVPSITSPFVADLFHGDPDSTDLAYTKGTRRWVAGPQGLPLFKPPYGRITAFNMNTGEQVWMAPNGDGPRDHPAIAHLNLGQLGWPGRPSPLLTKTLLFIGEGQTNLRRDGRMPPDMPVEIATNSGGPFFRAYDKMTGEIEWVIEMEAGVTGAPITYMHEGRQFIVAAIGDRLYEPELVAFALPDR